MKSFHTFSLEQSDPEYKDFNEAIRILTGIHEGTINEGILDNISSGIKSKIKFIKELIDITGSELKDALLMFKDKKFFKIFKIIGFSISKLHKMFKLGVKTFNDTQAIIMKYIAELGGVKYIKKNLHKLDEFFNTHPVLKKIGGLAVAGLLLYIWLNMSYSPVDVEFSLDFTDIISALGGKFSLADLFASEAGVTMLVYLVVGMVTGGITYYPGSQIAQIVTGLVWSSYRLIQDNGGFKNLKLPKPNIR